MFPKNALVSECEVCCGAKVWRCVERGVGVWCKSVGVRGPWWGVWCKGVVVCGARVWECGVRV